MKGMKIVSMLAVTLVMVSASFAAISSSGGTEDFETVGVADEAELTNGFLTDWVITDAEATQGIYYDTSSGGTLDTSGWSLANGSLSKPSSTADLKANITGAGSVGVILEAPLVTGRDFVYSWWVGFQTPPSNNFRTGIGFPNFGTLGSNSVHFEFQGNGTGTKDFIWGVRKNTSGTGATVANPYGSGATDDTDYSTLNWNKFEIRIETSSSAKGTATYTYNGTELGTCELIQDTGTTLESHKFFVAMFKANTSGTIYLDDLEVSSASGIDDWIIF